MAKRLCPCLQAKPRTFLRSCSSSFGSLCTFLRETLSRTHTSQVFLLIPLNDWGDLSTYGSEFVAAWISTNQIIDLRMTLRYLGVPVVEKSYLFGDNQSVVTSSTIPHSSLNKQHNALWYHRVWEAIGGKILASFHIDGKTNPSDVLSKHCGHTDAWPHLKWLLFWRGVPTPVEANDDNRIPITMRRHRPKWLQNGVY